MYQRRENRYLQQRCSTSNRLLVQRTHTRRAPFLVIVRRKMLKKRAVGFLHVCFDRFAHENITSFCKSSFCFCAQIKLFYCLLLLRKQLNSMGLIGYRFEFSDYLLFDDYFGSRKQTLLRHSIICFFVYEINFQSL
ncbi:uncharacterized protein LOC127788533 isoform X3 [Diospyros lotus]|uniref:uncharacterized protein LOC127788533 isoform X3 n=1 Tax=Diospyros lotus TaxID=55363 RepID=UPI00225BD2EA|nr:uncharacterized protein LOC127788533 isoform X3 [Diospyros lotus]